MTVLYVQYTIVRLLNASWASAFLHIYSSHPQTSTHWASADINALNVILKIIPNVCMPCFFSWKYWETPLRGSRITRLHIVFHRNAQTIIFMVKNPIVCNKQKVHLLSYKVSSYGLSADALWEVNVSLMWWITT